MFPPAGTRHGLSGSPPDGACCPPSGVRGSAETTSHSEGGDRAWCLSSNKESALNIVAPDRSASRHSDVKPLLLCLSHLRWDFVTQRPQHLLRRAAADFEIVFFEEPLADPEAPETGTLRLVRDDGVLVVTPLLPDAAMDSPDRNRLLRLLLDRSLSHAQPTVAWYYSPMMLAFSRHLHPAVTIYDCMDELSAFLHAPRELRVLEAELMERADLVFTGGLSLYETRRDLHPAVHCFPSSIDRAHFAQARGSQPDPESQSHIPHPRVGFFGVIDERMDLDLVARTAREAWELQFVMIGPVVKIDPATLPRAANIHWLGRCSYGDLPAHLAHWDVGWMPFALNEATRFISPTKTPEFLAAGLPLVSTAVRDVERSWGRAGLVRIADADTMTATLRSELGGVDSTTAQMIDAALAHGSWDRTWAAMLDLIEEEMASAALSPLPSSISLRQPQGGAV